MEGVVVHFDEPHGFGFIRPKDFSKDVFVHVQNIPDRQVLAVGQKVMFDTKKTRKGLLAINVIPGKKAKSPHISIWNTRNSGNRAADVYLVLSRIEHRLVLFFVHKSRNILFLWL